VRYEYNGALIALPYGHLLHQAPCPCVQRSKWLIHVRLFGSVTRTRAIATGLAHSRGKLMGVATFESKQTNDLYLLPSPWHLAQVFGTRCSRKPNATYSLNSGSCVDHDRKESAERNQENAEPSRMPKNTTANGTHAVIGGRVHNEGLGLVKAHRVDCVSFPLRRSASDNQNAH